jgi:ribosomal protein S18 acetylase RimI-like enzyme
MLVTVLLADLNNPTHQRAIVDLVDMYCRDEFGDSRPLPADIRERLIPGLVAHGGARVFLALDGDEPLGIAVCFLGFSTFRAQPLINIHDIAVAPAARGRGIGQALLAAVEAEARRLGCGKVTLEVRADNAVAMRAYQMAGFQGSEPHQTYFWSKRLD